MKLTWPLVLLAIELWTPSLAKSQSRQLDVEFFPSFMLPARVIVDRPGPRVEAEVSFKTNRYGLTQSQSRALFDAVHHSLAMSSPSASREGFDGIRVLIRYSVSGSTVFSNRLWSPSMGPEIDAIQALFVTMEGIALPASDRTYLEQLSAYFDFSVPWKLMIGSPITIRFYSSISTRHRFQLHRLFASIPEKAEVIVDMSEGGHMGTLLYEDFRAFAEKHNIRKWIATKNLQVQLRDIGIPAQRIVPAEEAK